MSSRAEILSRIRAQLPAGRRSMVGAIDTSGVLPIGAVRNAPNLEELFLHKVKQCQGTHARIGALSELPAHVAALLGERGLAPRLALAPDPALARLDWRAYSLAVADAIEPLKPETVLSCAAGAVAETGSIILSTAGASRPTHNLLAELHIAVLSTRQIAATPEAAWRAATAAGLPRGLVFVTGPSRTGDIEMSLELGAHGATGVHVVLVENDMLNA